MNAIYYECHVTVAPVFGERLEALQRLAAEYDFKVAKLLMGKGLSAKDSFCTGHAKDFESLQDRMLRLSEDLARHDFLLWRRKIEAVVLDERFARE